SDSGTRPVNRRACRQFEHRADLLRQMKPQVAIGSPAQTPVPAAALLFRFAVRKQGFTGGVDEHQRQRDLLQEVFVAGATLMLALHRPHPAQAGFDHRMKLLEESLLLGGNMRLLRRTMNAEYRLWHRIVPERQMDELAPFRIRLLLEPAALRVRVLR